MNRKKILIGRLPLFVSLLLFLNLLIPAPGIMASGFAVYTQNAGALGQANAVTAHTDSPSTIFFNPALLNTLDGTQIEIGTTFIAPVRRFTSATTGQQTNGEDNLHFPGTLYVSHRLSNSLSAGFSVTNPFGLGSDWPDDWPGRFITTESELSTYNLNPVVSWQVHPGLSVAAGVDYLYLDTTMKSRRMVGPFEGNQHFSGDGTSWGFNLALAIQPAPDWTLGISYRSRFDVDIKGDLTVELPTFTLAALQWKNPDHATIPNHCRPGLDSHPPG